MSGLSVVSHLPSFPRRINHGDSVLFAWLDFALLLLILMSATGTFFRIGLAMPLWLLVYAAVVLDLARRPQTYLKALPRLWPVLLLPAFCFASTLWSVEPQTTLKNSIQFLFTGLIGMWIGLRYSLEQLFSALLLAMLACVLLSCANIFVEFVPAYKQDDYVGAIRYFIGLYPQKNLMGNVLYLCALGLMGMGVYYRKTWLAYVLTLLLLPLLISTKSTTALLMYAVTLTLPLAWWFISSLEQKLLAVLFGLMLASFLLFFALMLEIDLVTEALSALGKDSSLTGRTVIWSTALARFDAAPFFGIGYQAFWSAAQYSSEVLLIRAAVLESISGFHNGHLEVLVSLGLLGLLFYWLMIGTLIGQTLRQLLLQTTPLALVSAYYVCLTVLRSFVESAVYFQHDLDFLMFCALLLILQRRDSDSSATQGGGQ